MVVCFVFVVVVIVVVAVFSFIQGCLLFDVFHDAPRLVNYELRIVNWLIVPKGANGGNGLL